MSKKSNTFAAEKPKVFFEICSATPCDKFKPHEAMSIREMLIRTERGQRLDVHTRFRAEGIPDNMYQAQFDHEGKLIPDKLEDTFDHTPPDGVNDIVDVIRYQEELNERREELRKRVKAKPSANAPQPGSDAPKEEKSEEKPSDE